ncbi:hypothetical protein AR1Y2_2529 [Anaerostipes rhamnosivorans]|uniref:Uncharacterized protein n=1 Tax=Anaerostipes rhamnosivorans TaxID=1229621 RepID=A0A4P8IJ00_9FIRM|nr:hypothetical protein AR1Y2_2529 [Anaerostipes rhamnosivorans]
MFHMIEVRHFKSQTEIMWNMLYPEGCLSSMNALIYTNVCIFD